MIWVVNTSSIGCHIYHYQTTPPELRLLHALSSAEVKALPLEAFSRKISHILEYGRNMHCYKKLIIIAPNHINGALHQELNQHVKSLVVNNIKMDVQRANEQELLEFLNEHAAR